MSAMMVDATVARSFAVVGWTRHLISVVGGTIVVAAGVHGASADDPSELRGIREALQRQAEANVGSAIGGRALSAVVGLDEFLRLGSDELVVVDLDEAEVEMAVRLQSRRPEDREWRRSLGARSRRLDAGEAACIAIASNRALGFASDDDDAVALWKAITGTPAQRTRDLLRSLVASGVVDEEDARNVYHLLQNDDLHNLCGPDW